MAATTIADIKFASEVFKATFSAVFTSRIAMFLSGFLVRASDNMISRDQTGQTASFTSWDALSGSSDKIIPDTLASVNALSMYKDTAPWLEREKVWGFEDLIKTITGVDPTKEVAAKMAEWYARDVIASAVAALQGPFASALLASHVYSAIGTTITPEAIANAKLLQGDNLEDLIIGLMHSKPYMDALKDKIAVDQAYADDYFRSGTIHTMLGMNVSLDDRFAAVAGVYPSYFGAPGAMVYQTRKRPGLDLSNDKIIPMGDFDIEIIREGLRGGGTTYVALRTSMLVHLLGMQYTGAANPTNATLATAGNWTKAVSDNKLIKVVQLKTL